MDNKDIIKNALLEIRRLKEKLRAAEEKEDKDIAVIGMACRFPNGINSPENYWNFLINQNDGVTDIPESRWQLEDYFDKEKGKKGKMYTDQGGFIDDVDAFDPFFFGISPREAHSIDPQHRLLLEVCWEALENAGCPIDRNRDVFNTGVFIGLTTSDYFHDIIERLGLSSINAFYGIGNSHNSSSGRISHTFGFTGPSMALDTACSSSLVAIHSASNALLNEDCEMALAGGVNLILNPLNHIITSQSHMLSPDGRCKSFDDGANGYVRSEGCGIVVLKKLSKALKDKDTILAVIKGSGTNHNATSSSLSVPNVKAQASLIESVVSKSNLDPGDISFIESHGTGTNLGDPIELRALEKVFAKNRNAEDPLYIGAAKSNIGHTESAAGVAGFIKAVLCLQHKTIPPNLHFTKPNTNFNWDAVPFTIPVKPVLWNSEDKKRYAGVSSFGVSGTNAHIILEEYAQNDTPKKPEYTDDFIVALSGKSKSSLNNLRIHYLDYITTHPEVSISDLSLTSILGRTHFDYRLSFKVKSVAELMTRLEDQTVTGVRSQESPLIFLFGGGDENLKSHASLLLTKNHAFKSKLESIEKVVAKNTDYNLSEKILSPGLELNVVDVFCIEYTLSILWRHWNIHPEKVAGINIGLFSAACVAGVFSFENAVQWLNQSMHSGENHNEFSLSSPNIPLLYGNGQLVDAKEYLDPEFWNNLILKETDLFLVDNLKEEETHSISFLPKNTPLGLDFISGQLIKLYQSGQDISWKRVFDDEYVQLSLPNYPFEKDRYWLEGTKNESRINQIHPFFNEIIPFGKDDTITVVNSKIPFNVIEDHLINGEIIVPGSAYIELLLAFNHELLLHNTPLVLGNVSLMDAITVSEQEEVMLQLIAEQNKDRWKVSIFQLLKDQAVKSKIVAVGTFLQKEVQADSFDSSLFALQGETISGNTMYGNLKKLGYGYGRTYQGVENLTIKENKVVGIINVPQELQDSYEDYIIHPALFDSCLQLAGAILNKHGDGSSQAYVPVYLGEISAFNNSYQSLKCHVELNGNKNNTSFSAKYHIYNELNEAIAIVNNVIFRQLTAKEDVKIYDKLYETTLEEISIDEFSEDKDIQKVLLVGESLENISGTEEILKKEKIAIETACFSNSFEKLNDVSYQFDPLEEFQVQKIVKEIAGSISHVIIDFSDLKDTRSKNASLVILNFAKQLSSLSRDQIPELILMTTSLEKDTIIEDANQFTYDAIDALISILNQEAPNLRTKVLQLDSNKLHQEVVSKAIRFQPKIGLEERISIIKNKLNVKRLKRVKPKSLVVSNNYKLHIDELGSFDSLRLHKYTPEAPKKDEVGLRIVSSGLNFKEVLFALGALPIPKDKIEDFEFGFECTGIVEKVGDEVEGIHVGDHVIGAIAPGSIGSYTNVNQNFTFQKPENLSFQEAATLPIVFITAYYALVNLANIDRNSRVLIHSAAGGVGLAAVQISQLLEADIYATASIPKHQILREKGVENKYNSRTLDFFEEINTDTNQRGVNVVLNSFSKDYIYKSLDLLEQGGHFLEIGKVSQETIAHIKQIRPDVHYYNFDIGELALEDPTMIRLVFENVLDLIKQGKLKPILHHNYAISQVAESFNTFSKGKNVGKIVLNHYENKGIPLFLPEEQYLITGGTGGLGVKLMAWMFEKGARQFIVVSRKKSDQEDLYSKIIEEGGDVQFFQADVSKAEDVKQMFDSLRKDQINIRGVFHLAGTINDKLIIHQDDASVSSVMAPKLLGGWNLHTYSQDLGLTYFVCFSSVASLLGAPGQYNYAAANGAMDSLVKWRRKQGLPGTIINWGPFEKYGMANQLEIQNQGIQKLTVEEDFTAIEIALRKNLTQICVADIDWDVLSRQTRYVHNTNFTKYLKNESQVIEELDSSDITIDLDELPEFIENSIKQVLELPKHYEMDHDRSLFDYGLDSLMALELKNKIEKYTKEEIPPTFLFNNPTLKDIFSYFNLDETSEDDDNTDEMVGEIQDVDELSRLLDEELEDL